MTFEELYKTLILREMTQDESPMQDWDRGHLDCLLHPEKYAPVIQTKACGSCGNSHEGEGERSCVKSCIFNAIRPGEDGKLIVDEKLCAGCGACIEACRSGKLEASRDSLPAMKAVHRKDRLSYAMVAPAFLGQFSEEVSPGKLRSAFRALGFDGMIEVALFADILTLKEALEFDRNITKDGDYQLTSCCCPIWIAMIRKIYHELMPHVPGAVSPMVACGRVIKQLHPGALTVFIGPCIAKKSEAREPDIADAVDYVLTFQELRDIFDAAGIDPSAQPESEKDHSSRAGRIYARTGGVSEAVQLTVDKLNPKRSIELKAMQADSVPACRAMIEALRKGEAQANFFEGMGCKGGCVGGPKSILPTEQGRENVEAYGRAALSATPLENPYVLELLNRLGFSTVEDLLEYSQLFTRNFKEE